MSMSRCIRWIEHVHKLFIGLVAKWQLKSLKTTRVCEILPQSWQTFYRDFQDARCNRRSGWGKGLLDQKSTDETVKIKVMLVAFFEWKSIWIWIQPTQSSGSTRTASNTEVVITQNSAFLHKTCDIKATNWQLLPDFKTLGTWSWQGCQPYAPAAFTPGNIPGTHFC
jgi:hypothetical protein